MTQQSSNVQLRVAWGTCGGGNWCRLNTMNLNALDAEGVYIIWHDATEQGRAAVVYVGQGSIRHRFADHRDDPRIQRYADRTLLATWAEVPSNKRDGVEAYLSQVWDPLVGERHPAATPISVNSPWD